MEKLFWGATEIAEYANVSRSSAINFMKRMRIMYDIDPQRCLYGKIPVAVVKDFFNQEVKYKEINNCKNYTNHNMSYNFS